MHLYRARRRWHGMLPLLIPAAVAAQQPVVAVTYDSTSAPYAFSSAERALIDSFAVQATTEVAALLPGTPARWTLQVRTGTQVIAETGETGFSVAPDAVSWTVNPAASGGVEGVIRARLRKVLFHELHHLVRRWTGRGGTPPETIMDAVVAEGLATVFARDHASDDATWGHAPADVAVWAAELKALPPSALRDYATWMFQHPDGRRWIGYRTGTWLVDRAVRGSGKSSIALVKQPSSDVLRLAGF